MSPRSKHIVAKGDTLSKIAKDHGFQNWAVVWNCDENANLRALRIKPERIVPGDEVSIPQRVQVGGQRRAQHG
jgi:nucleoid-associated protein YgaU